MDAVESLEIEEVLREWSSDDFKSFYEDVFPEGFDPFDNSHDATVPETSLDLLSNSSSLFDEMADLSQKYDSIEPEEALFRLLREDDSAEKVSCDVGVHSPRQGQAQGHVGVTKAVQNWRSKDVSYIKESQGGDIEVLSSADNQTTNETTVSSAATCTCNEVQVKDNSTKKRKRKASNKGSQTRWKLKKRKGQTQLNTTACSQEFN